MKIEIEISEKDNYLISSAGKEKLNECLKKYAINLLNEAERIESNLNSIDQDHEITASIIHDASLIINNSTFAGEFWHQSLEIRG